MKRRFYLNEARAKRVWFVNNNEGAIMSIFKTQEDAADFKNNRFNGYYGGCSITSTTENYSYWIKKAE